MARISTEKLELLKRLFTEKGMSPGQAAQQADVTYRTAKRYYEKWADDIKRALESNLVPSIEESIRRLAKRRKKPKPSSRNGSRQ